MVANPSVSRETVAQLVERYGLPSAATASYEALLDALAVADDAPTTLRGRENALERHVADGLSGLECEELRTARAICDVGAGAGFPGLVLAIALPAARVDLVEAGARKCAVIGRLAAAAGAANARALPLRAEDWAGGEGALTYDAVTARAVAPLAVLAEYAAPLLREGGVLVAWKGTRQPEEEHAGERAGAALGLEPRAVRRVAPFEGARDRHLHVYAKVAPTPPGFPRRAGMARKRPLA